jgi:predicted TIM-barrel fold metal-dependent hydrolase
MKKLFEWAAGENVPIFAHTDKDDMSPNRSYWTNADPNSWEDYLKKKETAALRLCFAHGGGDYYWTSDPDKDGEKLKDGSDAAWKFGYDIVQLCRKYEHVYLELGCLESVLDHRKHDAIIKRLTHDFLDKAPGPFRLGDKVMYGSDWTMLAQDPAHEEYLTEFNTIMRQVSGGEWHRKFFSGNAVKFLRLQERLTDGTRLHDVQRNHWRAKIIPNSQPTPTPTVD